MIVRIVVLVGGLPTYCNREKVIGMARASVLDPAIVLPDADDAVTNDVIAGVFANDALFSWTVEIAAAHHALNDYDLTALWLESTHGFEADYMLDVIDHAAFAAFMREMV